MTRPSTRATTKIGFRLAWKRATCWRLS